MNCSELIARPQGCRRACGRHPSDPDFIVADRECRQRLRAALLLHAPAITTLSRPAWGRRQPSRSRLRALPLAPSDSLWLWGWDLMFSLPHAVSHPTGHDRSMLVDVVPMRRDGAKMPQEELRLATPVRGHLSLKRVPWRRSYAPHLDMVPTVFAGLHPDPAGKEPTLLPALREARIERVSGDSLIVTGIHTHGGYMREVDYPQAWWCRLASTGPTPSDP